MNDTNLRFDAIRLLRSNWKRIALTSAIGLAGGVLYGLLAPRWYTAALSVVPTASPKGGLGSSIAGAAAAAGLADIPLDLGGGSDVDRISAVFHSTSVANTVIAKFNLQARYRAKYLEDAQDELWKHCSTRIDKKPAVLTLSCEDKVPAVAQAMTSYFAASANEVSRRISTSSAGEERRFLEKRVEQAKVDLDQASTKLREFQEQNKVISLPDQAKAIVSSMASLRAEMLQKQMQLAYVDSYSSSDESTTAELRRQVGILQAKLKSMEGTQAPADEAAAAPQASSQPPSGRHAKASGSLFPPAVNVPALQYQLEQLLREQKLQETLLMVLTQRYEIAKVNEARDTSTFQVLDNPPQPTKKSRPRLLLSVTVGLLIGICVGAAIAFLSAARARLPIADPASPR